MEQAYPELSALGIAVIAGNTEGRAETEQTQHDHGLSFPVAQGVPASAIEKLGALTGVRRGVSHMQPCEFVLRPDGTVAASLYASTQLGRMDPHEVLRFVQSRIS